MRRRTIPWNEVRAAYEEQLGPDFYPYFCGECGLSCRLTIAEMTTHWRDHQEGAVHGEEEAQAQPADL